MRTASRPDLLRPSCVLLFVTIAGQAAVVEAAGGVTMPFRYRNTQAGATIQGEGTFQDVYYDGAGLYCAANHRDPDGNKYGHAHLPHAFPFVAGGDTVTAGKSDWAWDAHYVSYTRDSGSTFTLNCFAHAAGAPTVMFHDGWTAWTNASTQCEVTTKTKSYGDAGHVIKIVSIYNFPEEPCVISQTTEKNASGGVYSHGWLPVGINADKPVRKLK